MFSSMPVRHDGRGKLPEDCLWGLGSHCALSHDMMVDRCGKRWVQEKNMITVSPLIALVPSCFLFKLKRSGFQGFAHLFGPLKLLKSYLVVLVKETAGTHICHNGHPCEWQALEWVEVGPLLRPPLQSGYVTVFKWFLSVEIVTFGGKQPNQLLDLLIT